MEQQKVVSVSCRVLSIPEVAKILGISTALAYRLVQQGEIPGARRIGKKRIVVIKAVFEEFLNGRQAKAAL